MLRIYSGCDLNILFRGLKRATLARLKTHGLNEYFKGNTEQQMLPATGSLPENISSMPRRRVFAKAALPDNFDAREKWGNCKSVRDIRTQGNCGACWAMSSASVMSDRECIFSNAKYQPLISTEYLLTCCSNCGYGCEGGFPSKAFNFWMNSGIPSGGPFGSGIGCQPYQIGSQWSDSSATPPCIQHCMTDFSLPLEKDKYYALSSYVIVGDDKHYMQEIYENGPVVTTFTVYEDFYYYQSGTSFHHLIAASNGKFIH
ncbi:unnamed protein product [Soboliphyme baturini]|uniref:Pept_C1 domain-containing protein n=1 Tax=Soboliphyme baturini TaxID=241478 RepID=A0A183IHF1_9BILA|nr:unnamed protein product [Soboliphyme baturini]